MKKVGILGGAFNPIHNTHLTLALEAYSQLNLDKVLMMPLHKPPHKASTGLAEDKDRLNMVEAAIEEYPMLEASDLELKREGLTYTSDTLELLNKEYPDTKFYFIIGGDSLLKFHTWHEPEQILRRAAIVCTGRGETDRDEIIAAIKRLMAQYSTADFTPEIHYLPIPLSNLSSTELRERIAAGIAVNGLIPGTVIDYIYENDLYLNEQYEEILDDLHDKLSPGRYRHTLGVAKTAYELAGCHGENRNKAFLAGLLHDCAKYLSDEQSLEEAERLGIETDEIIRASAANLLHSKIGAEWCSILYGVEDEDICNAISWHTTGRPEMSRLEKILFIADYIEPNRNFRSTEELDTLRAVATYDLDLTCNMILKACYEHLCEKLGKDMICKPTIDSYNYYNELIQSRSK